VNKELYYVFRSYGTLRAAATLGLVLMDLAFYAVANLTAATAAYVVSIIAASVGLAGLIILNAVSDTRLINEAFKSPDAYSFAMAPKKAFGRIGARLAVMIGMNALCFFFGIAGIVCLSMRSLSAVFGFFTWHYAGYAIALFVGVELFGCTIAFFASALEHGPFFAKPLGKVFAIACCFGAGYIAFNAVGIFGLIFGRFVRRVGIFFIVEVYMGSLPFQLLSLASAYAVSIALWLGAAALMDGRLNV